MTLKAKDWLPGMTVISKGGSTCVLVKRDADDDYCGWDVDDGAILDKEGYRPATYSDLSRSPAEGERAVWVYPGEGGLHAHRLGDVYVWDGVKFVDEDDGWQHAYKTIFAPLVAPEQPEPAIANACPDCGIRAESVDCHDGRRRCSECAILLKPEPPAPAECERVAAATAALEKDWKENVELKSVTDLQPIIEFADRWRDRLAEFTPCHTRWTAEPGSCDPCEQCAALIDADERGPVPVLGALGKAALRANDETWAYRARVKANLWGED